jgi:hypothetical protein
MAKFSVFQMPVEAGKQVSIVLSPECVAAGGGREYPNGGLAVMTGEIADHGTVARVLYKEPFMKRGDKKPIKGDWVPTWLLRSPEAAVIAALAAEVAPKAVPAEVE